MAGRILGIDLGEKRIGLALSDPQGIIASPFGKIEYRNDEQMLSEIEKLARERDVSEIVVGYPIRTSGNKGKPAQRAEAVARMLKERLKIQTHLFDERMSTRAAEQVLLSGDLSREKRREKIDQVSASLILQAFLEYRRTKI